MPSPDLGEALVDAFALNDRVNQVLLGELDPRAWRAPPPGKRTRTIAAIFSHVHNIRRKWLRLSAPHIGLPAELDRARVTQEQAREALAESAALCCDMIREALAKSNGRVKTFHRDGWAKPWPVAPDMVAYMLSHDAHHRGQVCMLAHQLGYPLSSKCTSQMWAWQRLTRPSDTKSRSR